MRLGRLIRYPRAWLRDFIKQNAGDQIADGHHVRERLTALGSGQTMPTNTALNRVSEDVAEISIETPKLQREPTRRREEKK